MKLHVVVVQLLRHFQATQEADFRYATLFWPNKKDDIKKKMEDELTKMKKMEEDLKKN